MDRGPELYLPEGLVLHGVPVHEGLFCRVFQGAPMVMLGTYSKNDHTRYVFEYLFSDYRSEHSADGVEPFVEMNMLGLLRLPELTGWKKIYAARWLSAYGYSHSEIHDLFKTHPMEETMAKLYELITPREDGRPNFGTLLTKNSAGMLVLEMKGAGGAVEVFRPEDVREVIPYTVRITGNHYEAPQNLLSVGDVVRFPDGDGYMTVQAINTKAKDNAGPLPKGTRRFVTEVIA